jgi:F0F1-type ATP synthase assembly protein I
MARKPHRNSRGLFLGAVLGAVVGYFAGRAVGNPAWGIILGMLAGAALLYRVNPGPRNRGPGTPGPRKRR